MKKKFARGWQSPDRQPLDPPLSVSNDSSLDDTIVSILVSIPTLLQIATYKQTAYFSKIQSILSSGQLNRVKEKQYIVLYIFSSLCYISILRKSE
jgi:hypothetical protein